MDRDQAWEFVQMLKEHFEMQTSHVVSCAECLKRNVEVDPKVYEKPVCDWCRGVKV